MSKTDTYLEDDGKLHRKLIVSCELATEREEVEDTEETKSLILHEKLLLA